MTDKSAAAIEKLAYKHAEPKVGYNSYGEPDISPDVDKINAMIADLTALIEEHYVKKEEHEKLVNAALQNKPQPTAEGAEEIEAELRGYARDIVRLHKPIMEVNPQLAMDSIGNDLVKMFNRLAQRLAEKMVEEDDLQKLMNDISEWSDKTFGNGQRNPAIIYHLKKEVDELIAAIEKTNTLGSDPSVGVGEFGRQRTVTRVEYADCLMLLLDSAHHFGISAKELLSVTRGKLEINKVRKWGSPDENGVVEHIE